MSFLRTRPRRAVTRFSMRCDRLWLRLVGRTVGAAIGVEVDGQRVPMTAELLRGDERAEAWRKLNQTTTIGSTYERRVAREIPVFRFTRRAT